MASSLTSQDKKDIENIAKKEIRDFMSSTQATKMVVKMIQDELGTKKINEINDFILSNEFIINKN